MESVDGEVDTERIEWNRYNRGYILRLAIYDDYQKYPDYYKDKNGNLIKYAWTRMIYDSMNTSTCMVICKL